jgi:hypothetical protein
MQERRPLTKQRLQLESTAKAFLGKISWTGSLRQGMHCLPADLPLRLSEAIEAESKAHAAVKKLLKRDRVAWANDTADVIADSFAKGDLRTAYQAAKKLAGHRGEPRILPAFPDGSLPTSAEEELDIWSQFLTTARGMRSEPPPPSARPSDDIPFFTEQEVLQALNSLPVNRAVRAGSTPAVFWRAVGEQVAPFLSQVFYQAGAVEYPQDWAISGLFWIRKSGKSGRDPSCFRDICLMEAVSKAYSKCLFWRVKDQLYSAILETQFGCFLQAGPRPMQLLWPLTFSRE